MKGEEKGKRMQVQIKPALLTWACERGGRDAGAFAGKFPQLDRWLSEEKKPTLKQLEKFANATHTAIGYLFLDEPPVENVPIPDLRTIGNLRIGHPSPDLLDTLYLCQQRQEWYRDFARTLRQPALGFVGSATLSDDIVLTARKIRDILGFDLDARANMGTWTEALRRFIEQADDIGILVMCSGVVSNNNRRALDPEEFRGFSISDELAPLVFINGKDTKSAQMFTLAHELAHIWLGESGLTDVEPVSDPQNDIESWCNRVAAELLVPLSVLKNELSTRAGLADEVKRLTRRFKVSSLVILRRIYDAGGLTREQLGREYRRELAQLRDVPAGTGGNFYLTQAARVSKRFARAVMVSTWEGQSSFTEAFRLLGCKKMATFREFGHNIGMTF